MKQINWKYSTIENHTKYPSLYIFSIFIRNNQQTNCSNRSGTLSIIWQRLRYSLPILYRGRNNVQRARFYQQFLCETVPKKCTTWIYLYVRKQFPHRHSSAVSIRRLNGYYVQFFLFIRQIGAQYGHVNKSYIYSFRLRFPADHVRNYVFITLNRRVCT